MNSALFYLKMKGKSYNTLQEFNNGPKNLIYQIVGANGLKGMSGLNHTFTELKNEAKLMGKYMVAVSYDFDQFIKRAEELKLDFVIIKKWL